MKWLRKDGDLKVAATFKLLLSIRGLIMNNNTETAKPTWRFPKTLWIANGAELLERAAFYGTFITLTLYLTRMVGFTDIETGWIVGFYAALMYFLPTFLGALADKIGFKIALASAFGLLSIGYTFLGLFQSKFTAIIALVVIMVGGATIKPVMAGTMSKCSTAINRARAFSIFYMFVNIGSFSGKMLAKQLRVSLGLEYINFYAGAMAALAFLIILLFYKNVDREGAGKDINELLHGLAKVVTNVRFMCIILIIAAFWAIQGQVYATMPKYTLRLIGEGASPEWLANLNPFVVVLLVVPITHLIRKWKPVNAMVIAFIIMILSAISIALSPVLESAFGSSIQIAGIAFHPITIMMIFGFALTGLAECFLSPKFLEFVSKLAPQGEIGLYMGYQYIRTFFAWLFGFAISGYLLDAYCPDPKTLTPAQAVGAYDHAHYIWYIFAGIGIGAFIFLLVFKYVTGRIDRKK